MPTNLITQSLNKVRDLHPKAIDLGLTRIARLLSILGNPQDHLKGVVHIAGTNGKGSTTAFLSDVLRSEGRTVNAYTSPHLTHFAERITLSCEPWHYGKLTTPNAISKATHILSDAMEDLLRINDDQPITEFEFITALALNLFKTYQADYTLLEVGLGGEYDATNVVQSPAATAITSIGLDHTDMLGNSIEDIAKAKAGIIKPHIPLFIPPNLPERAEEVIRRIAAARHAPVIVAPPVDKSTPLGLAGPHQYYNAGIAVAMAQHLLYNQHVNIRALEHTQWKGRLQMIPISNQSHPLKMTPLLLDGAHNVDGIIALSQSIQQTYPNQKMCVFAHIKIRKDYPLMLQYLATITKVLYIPTFDIDGGDGITPEMAHTIMKDASIPVKELTSIEDMQHIMHQEEGPFLATGSLFWVGKCLELSEPFTSESDSFNQQQKTLKIAN